mgnify:CR=1 FL=1
MARRVAEGLTHHGGYRRVYEVGPGTGALTRHLLERTDIDLVAVELDREAAAHLREVYPDLDLVERDFLGLEIPGEEPFAVIGNFPYNISTQIVFKVLAHRGRCMEMVGMFQKEVADRIRAPHGSRTYGITSVLTQAYYTVEELLTVPPEAFTPPPKVNSAVIRLQRNTTRELPCDEATFHALVKVAFNQRRKTLRNALKGFAPLANGVPERFAALRAEQLSVQDFITLALACGPLRSS